MEGGVGGNVVLVFLVGTDVDVVWTAFADCGVGGTSLSSVADRDVEKRGEAAENEAAFEREDSDSVVD